MPPIGELARVFQRAASQRRISRQLITPIRRKVLQYPSGIRIKVRIQDIQRQRARGCGLRSGHEAVEEIDCLLNATKNNGN
jgi:hypothetical protein